MASTRTMRIGRRAGTATIVAIVGLVVIASSLVSAVSTRTDHGRSRAPLNAPVAALNPLDPLSADEIVTTFKVIEQTKNLTDGMFFPVVKLLEPAKSEVQSWSPGQPFTRRAFANVFDRAANTLYEAVVDLRTKQLVSWAARPGSQPAVYGTEWGDADAIVHAYAPWKKAIRDRGIDPKDVYVDVWAPGDLPANGAPAGTRLLRALAFYQGPLPNVYDRPIEGIVVTIDMNKEKVVDFVDSGVRPVDTTTTGSSATQRIDLQPLSVKQPDGPSFQISNGRDVVWQNWHFRVDYSPREGLILHQIGYQQNGVLRPIIYRLSMSEIYVPYANPDPTWSWRSAFDIGEYNLGQYAEPLAKNVDVPENAVFFDEVAPTDTGSADGAFAVPHAAAMYERDGGSLWDRTDPVTYDRDARLARDLVVTAAYAIGNYTYASEYTFHMDGSISVRVNATGTTLNQGVATKADGDQYGTTVADGIGAPSHQHFFNFRIDFDVDGNANRVVEENTAPSGPAGGNAFVTKDTVLTTEQARDANPATNRSWTIQSTTKVNALGDPTGYEIGDGDTAIPYSSSTYPPRLHAPFAQHPFWVTRYKDGAELYAGGDYPNQGQAGDGLTAYSASPENVNGKDLVVWYTLGFTHHPQVEEYPVMTTDTVGFEIKPDGFFGRNPALDAPTQP
jgi:primary-amine oxidase